MNRANGAITAPQTPEATRTDESTWSFDGPLKRIEGLNDRQALLRAADRAGQLSDWLRRVRTGHRHRSASRHRALSGSGGRRPTADYARHGNPYPRGFPRQPAGAAQARAALSARARCRLAISSRPKVDSKRRSIRSATWRSTSCTRRDTRPSIVLRDHRRRGRQPIAAPMAISPSSAHGRPTASAPT